VTGDGWEFGLSLTRTHQLHYVSHRCSCACRKGSEELMKRAAMLNVIKASLLGSGLQSYQTPCVPGHVCECVYSTRR
jgi:hypothetical protein